MAPAELRILLCLHTFELNRPSKRSLKFFTGENKKHWSAHKENFRIREIDIGNFIHDFESIRQDHLKIGKFNYRFPNGESGADLVLRVEQFLDKNINEFQEVYPTIIITHAGTINAFRMLLENLTVSQYDQLPKPENGSILEYKL